MTTFSRILTFAAVIFSIHAIPEHGAVAQAKKHKVLQSLYTFDDGKLPDSFSANNATTAMVADASGDSQAVVVKLKSKDNRYASLAIQPTQPWNWGEFQDFSLAFDLGNSGDVSVQLYSSVSDNKGRTYTSSVVVPVGPAKTYYVKLSGHDLNMGQPPEGIEFGANLASGLRGNPPTWNGYNDRMFIGMWGARDVDLAAVSRFQLSAQNALRDKQFTIDNIRLIANPTKDEDFLTGIVDKYGQNAKVDFPGKVHNDEELIALRDAELKELDNGKLMGDRTKFSGWKGGAKLDATGYFRAAKIDGKWSLVTPDGYPYFSTGIDIIRLANSTTFTGYDFDQNYIKQRKSGDLTPEDSIGLNTAPSQAWATRKLTSATRAKMFKWLPKYEDKLGKHFGYRRQAHSGAMPRGETYSFYSANLERRYGEMGDHMDVWRKVTVDRMLNWGFTSFGNWVDPSYYQNDRIPYFANGWIIGHFKTVSGGGNFWHPMPDVFDPLFAERADATAKQVAAEVKNSPWCVGVFIDNEKSWGRSESDQQRLGIVIHTLTRDGNDCPLKSEFTRMMKEKYTDITKLNQAWEKDIASWEAFNQGFDSKLTSDANKKDYSDMLYAYAEKYFQIVHDSLEKHMPNHMYLGCRMANWGMPMEVVKASTKYADVLSFNSYTDGLPDHAWSFLDEFDKPCIIGEFHFGAISDTGLTHPGLLHCSNQADRARAYQEYVRSVVDNPNFVGCHWFQYMDSPLTGRALDGENYNIGFVRVTDVPYQSMVNAAKELHKELYNRRFGKK